MGQDILGYDDDGKPIAAPILGVDDAGQPIYASSTPPHRSFGAKAEGLAQLVDTIVPHAKGQQVGPGQRIVQWLRNPGNRVSQGAIAGGETGAVLGGMVGGPPGAAIGGVAGAGLGGFGGALLRGDEAGPAMQAGAGESALSGLTLGTGELLKAGARPMMRGAIRLVGPVAKKFGMDAPTELAIAEGVIPGTKGAEAKAKNIRNLSKNDKVAMLDAAGRPPATPANPNAGTALGPVGGQAPQGQTIDTQKMLMDVYQRVAPGASVRAQAGVTRGVQLPEALTNFAEAQKASGFKVTPTELDHLKREWDAALKNTLQQQRFSGTDLTTQAETFKALRDYAAAELERVAPGYTAQNARTMAAEGLRQGVAGRAAMPGGGLDNLAALYAPSAAHTGVRLLRNPAIRGGLAVGMDRVGQAAMNPHVMTTAPRLTRDAILQLLSQGDGR